MNPFPSALLLDPKGQRKMAKQQQQQQQQQQQLRQHDQSPKKVSISDRRKHELDNDDIVDGSNGAKSQTAASGSIITTGQIHPATSSSHQSKPETPTVTGVPPASQLTSADAGAGFEDEKKARLLSDALEPAKETPQSDDQSNLLHQPHRMIQDIYNVTERWNQAAKRQKVNNSKHTTSSLKPRNNGVPSVAMESVAVPPSLTPAGPPTIDLTADDDRQPLSDDDVVFVGDRTVPDHEVIYGRVEGAWVLAYQVPYPTSTAMRFATPGYWPSIRCEARRQAGNNIHIPVVDSIGMTFGAIDNRVAAALTPLLDSTAMKVRITIRLDMRKRKENEEAGRQTSDMYRVTINLFGPRSRAGSIGQYLSRKNVWLGPPIVVEAGYEVCNPHATDRAKRATQVYNQNRWTVRSETRKAEDISNAVNRIMEEISTAENIPEMETPQGVKTPLKPHQKQALWFMTQKEQPRKIGRTAKECNSFWRLERTHRGLVYIDDIRNVEVFHRPDEVFGGLLGDVMGLGKTLSILSLVVSSKDLAKQWVENTSTGVTAPGMPRGPSDLPNIQTTLLVCPLSTTSNWEEQIKEHLEENSLRYYLYHGSSRTSQPAELAKYDLVITTYSTVQRELTSKKAKPSPLLQVNFFRIVLDEAHAIREQATQSFKAIITLEAQRRWALTGTPIQNSLKDLGSVVKFLRLAPYDSNNAFAAVSEPLKYDKPSEEAIKRFRSLVVTFALRRDKDKIELPERKDVEEWLHLSDMEKTVYEYIQRKFGVHIKRLKAAISQSDHTGSAAQSGPLAQKKPLNSQVYRELLRGMMYMRQVCAHGIDLLDVDERRSYQGQIAAEAIDLDAEGDTSDIMMNQRNLQAYKDFYFLDHQDQASCAWCDDSIELPETQDHPECEKVEYAYILACSCLVCRGCFQAEEAEAGRRPVGTRMQCKTCKAANVNLNYVSITPEAYKKFKESRYVGRGKGKSKVLGDYTGPATKTKALLRRLLEDKAKNDEILARNATKQPGDTTLEKPIKSVIFSAWTSHLDLIEIALKMNDLNNYVRLDGTMDLDKRGKAIEKLRDDDTVHIMLATLGAGGVGLNFTVASKVYIMEPQYNPAVVAQAVDRVHRIGQQSEVTTVRFIMKDTIEQQVHQISLNKLRMAEMGLGGKKAATRRDTLAMLEGAYS
ncbi:hypothetical protein KEM54_004326 [Ascosphaera aggregata]|nr:hypothetical protein KEM54_004326 [Ascosphaera aggregata]